MKGQQQTAKTGLCKTFHGGIGCGTALWKSVIADTFITGDQHCWSNSLILTGCHNEGHNWLILQLSGNERHQPLNIYVSFSGIKENQRRWCRLHAIQFWTQSPSNCCFGTYSYFQLIPHLGIFLLNSVIYAIFTFFQDHPHADKGLMMNPANDPQLLPPCYECPQRRWNDYNYNYRFNKHNW